MAYVDDVPNSAGGGQDEEDHGEDQVDLLLLCLAEHHDPVEHIDVPVGCNDDGQGSIEGHVEHVVDSFNKTEKLIPQNISEKLHPVYQVRYHPIMKMAARAFFPRGSAGISHRNSSNPTGNIDQNLNNWANPRFSC